MIQQFPGDESGASKPPPSECPRCGSTNTKFCYYNNYNKSQPRHFCKSCKRHWTKGGTLRNIPAGRRRRNKRPRASAEPRHEKHLLNSNDQNHMSDILYQALIRSSTPQLGTILESNGTTACAAATQKDDLTLSSFSSVSAAEPWAAEVWSWNEIDCLASLWDRSDAEMMAPYKPIYQA